MTIDDRLLDRTEKAIGFKLYPWQREYIKRKDYDEYFLTARRSGKTTAYMLRILLESCGDVDYKLLHNMAGGTTRVYANWFSNLAMYFNEQLKAAGVYKYIKRKTKKWTRIKGTPDAHIYKDYIALLPEIEIHRNDARYDRQTISIEFHFIIFHARIKWIKCER